MFATKLDVKKKLAVTLACAALLCQLAVLNIPAAYSCCPIIGELDIEADVGSMHFRGEMAEFYILVSYLGKPINAKITAILYHNGTLHANLTTHTEHVSTGLYRVPYIIPTEASVGTYALVVNASTCTLRGTTLKSFFLSPTLTNWNAWLINMQGDLAIIRTDITTIKASLEAIDAKLVSIEGRIATIETDLGIIKADVDNINLTLTHIKGDIATMTTVLGNINGTLVSIQGDIANIKTDIGDIQIDISTINVTLQSINGTIVAINTNIGEIKVSLSQINAKLTALNETVATIETHIGTIDARLEEIQLEITAIKGNTVTISTTLGDINGTLVSIQGDIANIKTDIGDIKVSLPPPQTTTLGIPIASIFAIIAAVASSISAALLLRKRKH